MASIPDIKRSLIHILLALTPTLSACSSMTAWWTDRGPMLALQDPATGLLTYSYCDGNEALVFAVEHPNTFATQFTPKNNTGLAAAPGQDGLGNTVSLFYQDINDEVVQAVYTCNSSTGLFQITSSQTLIFAGMPSINEASGFAAAQLGEHGGLRVFFHDTDNTTSQIINTDGGVSDWYSGGTASPDVDVVGIAVAAMVRPGGQEAWVATDKDAANIEIAHLDSKLVWTISTFPTPLGSDDLTANSPPSSFAYDSAQVPFTLPSWPTALSQSSLALAFSTAENIQFLFYVGTDRAVHAATNSVIELSGAAAGTVGTDGGTWALHPPQDADVWPLADEPGAALAAAFDPSAEASDIRLYYVGGGGALTEARYTGGAWQPAGVVTLVPGTQGGTPEAGPGTSGSDGSDGDVSADPNGRDGAATHRLSAGAIVGICIGAIVGGLAVMVTAAVWAMGARRWWSRRTPRDELRGIRVRSARDSLRGVRVKSTWERSRGREENFRGIKAYREFGPLRWSNGTGIAEQLARAKETKKAWSRRSDGSTNVGKEIGGDESE